MGSWILPGERQQDTLIHPLVCIKEFLFHCVCGETAQHNRMSLRLRELQDWAGSQFPSLTAYMSLHVMGFLSSLTFKKKLLPNLHSY